MFLTKAAVLLSTDFESCCCLAGVQFWLPCRYLQLHRNGVMCKTTTFKFSYNHTPEKIRPPPRPRHRHKRLFSCLCNDKWSYSLTLKGYCARYLLARKVLCFIVCAPVLFISQSSNVEKGFDYSNTKDLFTLSGVNTIFHWDNHSVC